MAIKILTWNASYKNQWKSVNFKFLFLDFRVDGCMTFQHLCHSAHALNIIVVSYNH
jgi:hypothetical protein